MNIVKKWAGAALRVLKSRIVSATALATAAVMLIMHLSINLNVYTVKDGNEVHTVWTMDSELKDIVEDAGIVLEEGDELFAENGAIEVTRAFDVQITVDGSTSVVRMTGGTVADALEMLGVEYDENDTVNLTADQKVSDGLAITIDRVEYKEYTKTESLPYETTVKYTNTIKKGVTKVWQSGKRGEKTYVYRDRYVNGELVETVLVSEKVTKKPVNKITLKGTVAGTPMSKPPFDIPLDEAGQPLKFKKMYTGLTTAYTNEGGILSEWTASGMRAQVGVVAVDPKKIPYGTKLYITSPDGSYVYGYAIAGDTGNRTRQGILIADLFMNTVAECYQHGKRTMNVYVLE